MVSSVEASDEAQDLVGKISGNASSDDKIWNFLQQLLAPLSGNLGLPHVGGVRG
jgi:hypothetical protein